MAQVDLHQIDKRFAINEDDLATEWRNQPKLYIELSLEASKATANRMRAEVVLKTVEAELSQKYRKEGLGENVRTTEDGIKAAIRTDKLWLDANDLLIQATEQELQAQGVQEAARMRERSLKWIGIINGVGAPPEQEEEAVSSAKRTAQMVVRRTVEERREAKQPRG